MLLHDVNDANDVNDVNKMLSHYDRVTTKEKALMMIKTFSAKVCYAIFV